MGTLRNWQVGDRTTIDRFKWEATARVQAAISGIPDYAFVTIPYPIGRLREDELEERTRAALPQVLGLLCNE